MKIKGRIHSFESASIVEHFSSEADANLLQKNLRLKENFSNKNFCFKRYDIPNKPKSYCKEEKIMKNEKKQNYGIDIWVACYHVDFHFIWCGCCVQVCV